MIPAKNESKTIVQVITEVKRCYVCDIIVVDDASEDNTAQLAKVNGATSSKKDKLLISSKTKDRSPAFKNNSSYKK